MKKILLAVLAACAIVVGCSGGGGMSGTYSASGPGGSMSVTFEGSNFTMTTPFGNAKGTYTKEGNTVKMTATEIDGKPPSEKDKEPQSMTVSADGSSLEGPGGMSLKKG